jgi:hypothetical protein
MRHEVDLACRTGNCRACPGKGCKCWCHTVVRKG